LEEKIKKYIVIGDLHGDLNSMIAILSHSKAIEKLINDGDFGLIFLGDYIERNLLDHQVLRSALILKSLFPNKVYMLRGNNEDFEEEIDEKRSLDNSTLEYLNRVKGKFPIHFLKEMDEYFEKMTHILLDRNKGIVFVHGGVPPFLNLNKKDEDIFPYIKKLENLGEIISFNNCSIPRKEYNPKQLLWSRIVDRDNVPFDSSNEGYPFGKKQTEKFLEKLSNLDNGKKYNTLIKGHDPTKETGLDVFFDQKVLVLHSTGGIINLYNLGYSDIYFPSYIFINEEKIVSYHIIHSSWNIGKVIDEDWLAVEEFVCYINKNKF